MLAIYQDTEAWTGFVNGSLLNPQDCYEWGPIYQIFEHCFPIALHHNRDGGSQNKDSV